VIPAIFFYRFICDIEASTFVALHIAIPISIAKITPII